MTDAQLVTWVLGFLGNETKTFTSNGNVDVYRSSDLLDFGATPYAADQPTGTYTDTAANGEKFFYILVTEGDPAP